MRRAPDAETSSERFARLATARTNQILRDLRILGNCANRHTYSYTQREVDAIFTTIERRLKETKARFRFSDGDEFRL